MNRTVRMTCPHCQRVHVVEEGFNGAPAKVTECPCGNMLAAARFRTDTPATEDVKYKITRRPW